VALLLKIAKWLQQLSTGAAKVSVWLILALMLVIVTDVTLRHWFVIGSTKLQELEWHLHGALFLMCLGWAYTKNAHVRIELLSEKLSKRGAAIVEMLGCLLFLLPYVAAILIFGFDYMAFSLEYNEASASATGLPNRWIIKSFILTGFCFLGIAALSRFFESLVYLFGDKKLAEQTFFAQNNDHQQGAA
tara:strand:- start:18 stop:584 length:567 start_codon:yes stop_codon:yes gene_type:complete